MFLRTTPRMLPPPIHLPPVHLDLHTVHEHDNDLLAGEDSINQDHQDQDVHEVYTNSAPCVTLAYDMHVSVHSDRDNPEYEAALALCML
jgi:hypothetical protein